MFNTALPASKPNVLCAVQSPSLTMLWAVTLNITIWPLVAFTFDTSDFSQMYSRPELALLSNYCAFGLACSIAGPDWFDALDVFYFYAAPFHFWWRMYLICLCFLPGYVLAFQVIRRWNK